MRTLEPRDAALGVTVVTALVLLVPWFLNWPRAGRSTGATSARATDSGSVRAPTSDALADLFRVRATDN